LQRLARLGESGGFQRSAATACELDECGGLLRQRKEEKGRFHGQLEAMSSGASARIRSCHLGRWRRRVFQRS